MRSYFQNQILIEPEASLYHPLAPRTLTEDCNIFRFLREKTDIVIALRYISRGWYRSHKNELV